MRIAYVVDVHDRFEAVPDALARIGDVDLLLVGGDITTGGTPDDAARAVELWQPLVPQLLAVAGNMDSAAIDCRLVELGVAINGRGVVIGDIGVAGVSGSPPTTMHTPHELDDEEIGRRAEAALQAIRDVRVRIFTPHAPPHETACDQLRPGEHVGSVALRRIVEREQPDVVLCGHIHQARGTDLIGTAQIVNPGPVAAGHYAIVEVDQGVRVALD